MMIVSPYDISKRIQRLLNSVEARIFIVSSLSLQIALFFLGSMRKRTASSWVALFLWVAYLSADYVATYTLGLISSSQGDDESSPTPSSHSYPSCPSPNDQLLAFWAPFLLLHLGGQDTITSLALEDNALWLRQGLSLVVQVLLAIYVFLQTLPCTKLWLASVLMFLAGILKYGERTVALYYASVDGIKNSLSDTDINKLEERYGMKADMPTIVSTSIPDVSLNPNPEPFEDTNSSLPKEETDLLEIAYNFFTAFKRLIIDLNLTSVGQNYRRFFLSRLSSREAFQVIEMELSFMSDMLHTKAPVTHSYQGWILRLSCTCCTASAFVLFFLVDKKEYHPTDVAITYVLLFGAIALDFVALVLLFSSDWTVVTLNDGKCWRWLQSFTSGIHNKLRRPNSKYFSRLQVYYPFKFIAEIKLFFMARWSNSMGQYNLINFCLCDQKSQQAFGLACFQTFFKKILQFCNLKQGFDIWQYTKNVPVSDDLKDLIFERLKVKVRIAEDSERRESTQARSHGYYREQGPSLQAAFDEILLLWHIATDLCHMHDTQIKDQERGSPNIDSENQDSRRRNKLLRSLSSLGKSLRSFFCPSSKDNNQNTKIQVQRKISKEISEYLLYILVCQPFMLSSMAGIRDDSYEEACADVKKFFKQGEMTVDERRAYEMLWDQRGVGRNQRATPLLDNASRLARSLTDNFRDNRWEIISEVWVEMLMFAATQCKGTFHARRLSAGGELLTFAWLFIEHLGVEKQYSTEAVNARTKSLLDAALLLIIG